MTAPTHTQTCAHAQTPTPSTRPRTFGLRRRPRKHRHAHTHPHPPPARAPLVGYDPRGARHHARHSDELVDVRGVEVPDHLGLPQVVDARLRGRAAGGGSGGGRRGGEVLKSLGWRGFDRRAGTGGSSGPAGGDFLHPTPPRPLAPLSTGSSQQAHPLPRHHPPTHLLFHPPPAFLPLPFGFYSPFNRAGTHDTDWG